MYSTKILGITPGKPVTNHSTSKAQLQHAIKGKKSFSQKPAK